MSFFVRRLQPGNLFRTSTQHEEAAFVLLSGICNVDWSSGEKRIGKRTSVFNGLPHAVYLPHGYQICLLFLKLFEKIYAPLTAGILEPFAADQRVPAEKTSSLDRQYLAVVKALDNLVEAVGLKAAWFGVDRCGFREDLLLYGEIGIEIYLRSFYRFVSQPKRD